jgi:hypothetical protein
MVNLDEILSDKFPIRKQLHDYYLQNKLCINDGMSCAMFSKCEASCRWEAREILPTTGAYVGEEYDKYRILFVGINTNEGSPKGDNFYLCYEWISGDDDWIAGTIHRSMKKILRNNQLIPFETKKYFAFTNSIKCSVKKNAGNPTFSMDANCLYRKGYLFDEIRILSPNLIITLGDTPFYSIQSNYIDSVKVLDPDFKDRLISIIVDGKIIPICRLYNPGQGYRTPRAVYKNIRENNIMPKDWKRFFSDEPKLGGNIYLYLENKYQKSNRIDKANPLYDEMFSRLLSIINIGL